MLNKLHIENYALIEALDLDLHAQFNTITGETGAGKSIMLGALGLLMGKRADTKVLLNEEQKCVVEAQFKIGEYKLEHLFDELDLDYEDETLIRREISPKGKSRAFINDIPVTLDVLKSVSERLLDIHSQHETLLINKVDFQTNLIDSYSESLDLKLAYDISYKQVKKLRAELSDCLVEQDKNNQEKDYTSFLVNELKEANVLADELEKLEESHKVTENIQVIKESLASAHGIIDNDEYSLLSGLREALQQVKATEQYSEDVKKIKERLDGVFYELEDINKEINTAAEQLEYDPEKAAETEERINLLNQLCQKHHVTSSAELIQKLYELEDKLHTFTSNDSKIVELEKQINTLDASCRQQASRLFENRDKALASLAKDIEGIVQQLGMPEAKFEVKHLKLDDYGSNGVCEFDLLFSANKGIAPQSIQKVASGGEFSRLMFAIKQILARKVALPTLIFDEIDTGISGEVAIKMSKQMQDIATHHQIIVITHLPQIAAKGSAHYFVYKQQGDKLTQSHIKQLDDNSRLVEIAKMIGGDNYTETALQSAKELVSATQEA